jgi:hypothetical protein
VLRDHIAGRKTQTEHQAQGTRLATLGARTDETAALLAALRRRVDEDAAGLRDELLDELAIVRERLDEAEATHEHERAALDEDLVAVHARIDTVLAEQDRADRAGYADERRRAGALEELLAGASRPAFPVAFVCGGRPADAGADMRRMCHEMAAARAEQGAELAQLRAQHDAELAQLKDQQTVELRALTALREQAAVVAPTKVRTRARVPRGQAHTVVQTLKRKHEALEQEGAEADAAELDVIPVAKRTRTRKAAAVLGRTAVVATVGAVAAWSALAFA